VDATAPVANTSDVKIETIVDPSTFDMTVRVSVNGRTKDVTITPAEIADYQDQGLNTEQIVDRAAKTLIAVLKNVHAENTLDDNDIPF